MSVSIKKTHTSRKITIFIIGLLFILQAFLSVFIGVFITTRMENIYSQAYEKFFDAKSTSIMNNTKNVANLFDQLMGDKKELLNVTAVSIQKELYSIAGRSKYTYSNILLNDDYWLYLKGNINSSINRSTLIPFFDFNNDGKNDYETPGGVVFGDIITNLTITGSFYVQVNCSINGKLSSGGKVFIYANKNTTHIKVDITRYYNESNYSFNNSVLTLWNEQKFTFPSYIEEKLKVIEPDYLESYFLVTSPNISSVTIYSAVTKSRLEGCINGNITGSFKGIIFAKLNGAAEGFIDLRPKELYPHLISLFGPLLEWTYFATPDYFLLFPYAPDYRYDVVLANYADYDWLNRAWYNEILSQEEEAVKNGSKPGMRSYFSNLGVDYTFKYLFISLGQPIYNETGGFEGLLVVDFNLDILMEQTFSHSQEEFTLICNTDGNILLSPEYFQNITRKPKEVFPTQNIYDNNNSQILEAFEEVTNLKNGYKIVELEGIQYLVSYSPIISIDWYMLHFTPLAIIEEEFQLIQQSLRHQLKLMQYSLIVGSIILVAIIGTVVYLFLLQLQKYIAQLVTGINLLSVGDYQISFEITRRKKVDEFTEVLLKFEEMAIKLEQMIAKERESAYIANLAIDIFSHDIANFQQALLGYIELLKGLTVEEKKNVGSILRNMESILLKLDELRQNVVRLQQIEKEAYNKTTVKLAEIINKVAQELRTKYPDVEIKINIEFETNFTINSNEVLLSWIFSSIFKNGIHNAINNKITFWIKAKEAKIGERVFVELEITDNSKGISDALKKQILDSFKTGYRIRGIDHILIYKILSFWQGTLTIKDRVPNDPKKGARFIIRFLA